MSKTKRMADMAIMLSILIVLNLVSFDAGVVLGQASFVYFGGMISGFMLGPIYGGVVAGLADIIAHFIAPKGAFLWVLSISSALMSVFAGFIYHIVDFKNINKMTNMIIKTLFSSILIYLVISLVINSLALTPVLMQISPKYKGLDFNTAFKTLMIARAIRQSYWVIINGIITVLVGYRLRDYMPRPYIEKIRFKHNITFGTIEAI